METYTEEINGIRYTFSSEESLRPFAEPLLEAIEYIPPDRIRDGFKIRAGFSTFMLSEHGGGFDIAAPDYTDDPFVALTTDLTLALLIQYEQVKLLRKYGIEGKAAHFSEKMAVAKGSLSSEYIYMHRIPELGSSGWVVERLDIKDNAFAVPEGEKEYETIRTYELLDLRPALLDALALPDDHYAVFRGNELIELMDGDMKSLL